MLNVTRTNLRSDELFTVPPEVLYYQASTVSRHALVITIQLKTKLHHQTNTNTYHQRQYNELSLSKKLCGLLLSSRILNSLSFDIVTCKLPLIP